MERLVKHKWIIFVIIIVAVLLFDAIVNNVSIDDRGIVIGLGIDTEGEELLVSAQILLPKNGGISNGGNKHVVLHGKDKTIKGACDQISDRLGMNLSLAHTMMIIVSRQILAQDKIYLLKDFLTDDEVSDITGLAMSEGMPKDILEANIAYGEISSLQIQRMLKSEQRPIGMTSSTIKDFAVSYFARNAACTLPIVHKIPAQPNSDQQANQQKDAEEIIINRTATVTKSGNITELSMLANDGLSLVQGKIQSGTITIAGEDKRPISVQMLEVTCTPKYSLEDMSITFNFNVKCLRGSGRIDKTDNISYLLSDKEKELFKEQINIRVKQAWDISVQNSADFWRVYEGFYQKFGKKWANKVSENYLSQLSIKTNVKIIQR